MTSMCMLTYCVHSVMLHKSKSATHACVQCLGVAHFGKVLDSPAVQTPEYIPSSENNSGHLSGWTKHSEWFPQPLISLLICFIYPEYRAVSNCKFAMAKKLIPEILDSVEIKLLHKFFRKSWHYIDAYGYVPLQFHNMCLHSWAGKAWMFTKQHLQWEYTSLTVTLVPSEMCWTL